MNGDASKLPPNRLDGFDGLKIMEKKRPMHIQQNVFVVWDK